MFIVAKYERLYNQAISEGTLVEMPAEFQRAHEYAQNRNIFTRPDILVRESAQIQSGIRSIILQYRINMSRLQDAVTQDIASLRAIVDESQEYIFPQWENIAQLATILDVQLKSGKYIRVDSMQALANVSWAAVEKATYEFDLVKKEVLFQDILGLKNELIFLDSFYRVAGSKTVFGYKALNKKFRETFTQDVLKNSSTDTIKQLYISFSETIESYRTESSKIRAEARIKRADMVAKELKKWTETPPPTAPLGNIYTQIVVSLRAQMMYVYEDNELILSTPITSGRRDFETIRGKFQIYTKQRDKLMKSPFPDEDYELWVDYWLPFSGAYGIHDACNSKDCWRTRFGGTSYVYNGSHGCINTPYNAVKFIYGWSRVGTTVYIY